MIIRLTKRAIETLEFRGLVIALCLIGAMILYFSAHHGHRPDADAPAPSVPTGEAPPPSRI